MIKNIYTESKIASGEVSLLMPQTKSNVVLQDYLAQPLIRGNPVLTGKTHSDPLLSQYFQGKKLFMVGNKIIDIATKDPGEVRFAYLAHLSKVEPRLNIIGANEVLPTQTKSGANEVLPTQTKSGANEVLPTQTKSGAPMRLIHKYKPFSVERKICNPTRPRTKKHVHKRTTGGAEDIPPRYYDDLISYGKVKEHAPLPLLPQPGARGNEKNIYADIYFISKYPEAKNVVFLTKNLTHLSIILKRFPDIIFYIPQEGTAVYESRRVKFIESSDSLSNYLLIANSIDEIQEYIIKSPPYAFMFAMTSQIDKTSNERLLLPYANNEIRIIGKELYDYDYGDFAKNMATLEKIKKFKLFDKNRRWDALLYKNIISAR